MKMIDISLVLLLTASVCSAKSTREEGGDNHKPQGGGNYSIAKHTISSGGGVSQSTSYKLTSSIGQIDAGHKATTTSYTFRGGFLNQAKNDLIFKNGFE